MAKKKKKYYTVWKGHHTGVFETWDDCKAQITNFKGAVYKSFTTFDEAKKAYKSDPKDYLGKDKKTKKKLTKEQLERYGEPNLDSISVDAAVSGNPGKLEYRGVDTKSKKQLFKQGPFESGTNNIGEFLAIIHGLAYLKKRNANKVLYTDSRTAMAWIRKRKCNTKVKKTKKNAELFNLIERAEKWLQENAIDVPIVKWETKAWGEIPADFGRK